MKPVSLPSPHFSNTPLSIYLRTFLYLFDVSLGRVGQSQQSFAALMSNRRPLHSCDLGGAAAALAAEDGEVSGGRRWGRAAGPFRAQASNRKLAVLFLPQILFVTRLSITCLSALMASDSS